jgi:hypothetical protein
MERGEAEKNSFSQLSPISLSLSTMYKTVAEAVLPTVFQK